eukprot:278911-Pyramimonas_sp.AAC.1
MLEQGRACFFPQFAPRAALDSRRWPTRLLVDKVAGDAIAPSRGIVAGPPAATFEVKAYMLPTIRQTDT